MQIIVAVGKQVQGIRATHLTLDIIPSVVDVDDLLVLGVWIVLAHRVEKRVLQDVQILVGRDGSADNSAQEDDQEQSEVEEDQESVFLFKKKHFNH